MLGISRYNLLNNKRGQGKQDEISFFMDYCSYSFWQSVLLYVYGAAKF
jgi:hypothetical protein